MDGSSIGDAIVRGFITVIFLALIAGALLALGGGWIFHHLHFAISWR